MTAEREAAMVALDAAAWGEPCSGEWISAFSMLPWHETTIIAIPEFQSTPLVACILAGQVDVALLLLDHGANPHALSEFDGLTPMQAARQTGLSVVVERLRTLGA